MKGESREYSVGTFLLFLSKLSFITIKRIHLIYCPIRLYYSQKIIYHNLQSPQTENSFGTTKTTRTSTSDTRTTLTKTSKLSKKKMGYGILTLTTPSCSTSIASSRKPPKLHALSFSTLRIQCSNSSPDVPLTSEKLENDAPLTGSAFDFKKATLPLTDKSISSSKKVTLVRHGLSSWNVESRVQGSSNLSLLTETGVEQAERCKEALANIYFDQCFSSPVSRAKSTAEIIWEGREQPLVFLDSLKEAHLYYLEGMKNVDAKQRYPKEYTTWREDPANFQVNGFFPLLNLWGTAREAWREILLTPGEHFLVITHKSILRALICTALGLGPERFRAIDVNNGGISVFNFNKRGEAMLQSLNMTAHMYSDHVYL